MGLKCFVSFFGFLVFSINTYSLSLGIGSEVIKHDYIELSQNNAELVSEKGELLGAFFNLEHLFAESYLLQFKYGLSKGDTDYDGATQGGTPLASTTDQSFNNYQFKFEYLFAYKNLTFSPSLSYSNWQWQREIQATSITLPLALDYEWNEAALGVSLKYPLAWGELNISLQRLKTLKGETEIDLRAANFGRPVLQLGDQYGKKFLLEHNLHLSSRWHFKQSIYYREKGFKRSDPARIFGGGAVVRIEEPQSETKQKGLALSIAYNF